LGLSETDFIGKKPDWAAQITEDAPSATLLTPIHCRAAQVHLARQGSAPDLEIEAILRGL
jgi:hypothetical protein